VPGGSLAWPKDKSLYISNDNTVPANRKVMPRLMKDHRPVKYMMRNDQPENPNDLRG